MIASLSSVAIAWVMVLVVCVVWIGYISVLVYRLKTHYNRLTSGASRHGLQEILERIMQSQTHAIDSVEQLHKRMALVERESGFHIQKIGYVRFNPFGDTGGEQSFALTLLDNHDSGIVLSSLFSRGGVRWYTKRVVKGKAADHRLSVEEEEAVRKAKHLSHYE